MKNLNWNERFVPHNLADEDDFSTDSISLSVQEKLKKLENEKGQIVMTNTKKKVRPIIIAAAAVATAAISMISVNAATDGAITDAVEGVVSKVKVFINGEEVEADAYLVDSGVDEDGNEYVIYECEVDDDDSTMIIATEEDYISDNGQDEIDLTDSDIEREDVTMVYDGEEVREEESEASDN